MKTPTEQAHKYYTFSWDWKAQPPWIHISESIKEMNELGLKPIFYEVETGSDEYGLVISSEENLLDDAVFDLWWGSDDV